MAKRRRTLLDDKMETRSLIPRTAPTFKSAFPNVKTLRVEATESGEGVRFGPEGHPLVQILNDTSIQPTLHCSNPRCQQGGFDVESLLRLLTYSNETEHQETVYCCGHEGSPKGRHKGRTCENSFQLKVSIAYEA